MAFPVLLLFAGFPVPRWGSVSTQGLDALAVHQLAPLFTLVQARGAALRLRRVGWALAACTTACASSAWASARCSCWCRCGVAGDGLMCTALLGGACNVSAGLIRTAYSRGMSAGLPFAAPCSPVSALSPTSPASHLMPTPCSAPTTAWPSSSSCGATSRCAWTSRAAASSSMPPGGCKEQLATGTVGFEAVARCSRSGCRQLGAV